ncbi:hypothetical protein GCM10008171_10980 [Methylopila jiangsuensis]|uniref:Lipoprotein n=1 Tax=Methylopila jiangsuensis TaxID=586230 RepID=A0A9W6JHG5_9HYPH|nr:hypothetical protein [Methylopila jiangsuensis]MDR6286086.1 hypothetical protein [Methylopila jiangsuensis]GLK75844.1 hypothetical protein GCM10008171_10980 [Methylopila jiangsuensis]
MRFAALAPIALLGMGLSACVSHPPIVENTARVQHLEVTAPATANASGHFTDALRLRTLRESTRYGRADGAPKRLHVVVTDLHYKNPAMALLVGDANRASAKVTVVDAATGRSQGEFDTVAIDQAAINGIAGAVIAVAQDRQAADLRLADGLSRNVMERVYGSEEFKQAQQRPLAPIEVPAARPAEQPAPATPAPKAPRRAEPKVSLLAE